MYIYHQCGSATELTAGLGGGGCPWEGWEVSAVHLETWSIFWWLGQLSTHCREGGREGGGEGGEGRGGGGRGEGGRGGGGEGREGRGGKEGGRVGGREGGRKGGRV